MTYAKGRHPGAIWRKSDFQVHTPRDAQWSGSASLPGGSQEAEAARESWADQLIAKCLELEIQALGITDHHDITFYPYVQRAIARSHAACDTVWLFPGMEITCDDSVQCLMLFDRDTSVETIRRLFGIMSKVAEPPTHTAQAPQATLCGKEVQDFLGAAFEDDSFRGRSIVLPHASKGGHKNILRKGFHPRFADLEVDGVYNEKNYTELDEPTLNKIYGKSKDWGDRRRGILTTGDNRSATFDTLGKNSCWVRLGEPTAEAIRQAVLADEARIAYQAPAMPSQRVLELRVSSRLTGAAFELTFNDGFNALIGGRGSGKSAILEYLRFGLGRSTVDTDENDDSQRERDLVKSTLVGGYVEVDLERDGVREIWRRTLDRQAFISIRGVAGEAIELPIATAHERFRARAFSQKQLSTLVRRPETADEQITGIAAAESVDLRRQCEQKIETCQRDIHLAFQEVVQKWAAEAAFDRATASKDDLERRVEATRQRLEHGGLSVDYQAILNLHPVYARTESQFTATKKSIDDRLKILDQLSEISLDGWAHTAEVTPVFEARDGLVAVNNTIANHRNELRATLLAAQQSISDEHTAFKEFHAEFTRRYEEASAAQQHLAVVLSDYTRLSDELEMAEQVLRTAEGQLEKFSEAENILTEKRTTLVNEVTNLRRILNDASTRVETMSNSTLRARVEDEAIPQRRLHALIDLCERCAIRDLEQRCADKVSETSMDDGAQWEALLEHLLRIRHGVIRAGEGSELDPALLSEIRTAVGWELTENQAKNVLARLDDGRLGHFLSAWAAPFVRFEYRDRGTYMAFERASPGQQASALLTLLLNQEAGTLIIDQPEDDLDNKIIMSIVKLLQTTKRKRQLIFATHNPNFVVNGDADKVVALTPNVEPSMPGAAPAAQIEIETDGAIETPSVRNAITDTMEGGREAFELRGRKYAFEAEPPDAAMS